MKTVSFEAVAQVLRDQGVLNSPEHELNFEKAVYQAMYAEGASSLRMPFGKYGPNREAGTPGKTLYEIMMEDPKYIHGYMLNQDYIKEKFADLYAECVQLARIHS